MNFPVIVFKNQDNFIYYFDKEKSLMTTTERLLGKKIFSNCKIVDSSGFVYKFKNAKKIGYVGFYGINPLLKSWWNNREILIEMEFEPDIVKIELNDLKSILIEKVEKSKSLWNEAWSLKELKQAIQQAETFQALIIIFK